MRKFRLASILAVAVAAFSVQETFAWCKFNFGVGANIGFQKGGRQSILWGAWQSNDFPAQTYTSQVPMTPSGAGSAGCFLGGAAPAEPAEVGPPPQAAPEPPTAKPASDQQPVQQPVFVPVTYQYWDSAYYYPVTWYSWGQ